MKPNILLRANAAFLMLMGGGAAVADAAGHFLGVGPLAQAMYQAPLAISSFEAHLLALILGVVLWRAASVPERGPFHLLAATVHFVLGGSNLLFFNAAFGTLNIRTFGVVITTIHFAFVLAQGAMAARLLRAPHSSAAVNAH